MPEDQEAPSQSILPPPDAPSLPDAATQKGISDFTGGAAADRVLHINLGFFKYGTNDKVHAAALILAVLLLIFIMIVAFAGMFWGKGDWNEKVFGWLGNAFLFTSGIALGGKTISKSEDKQTE